VQIRTETLGRAGGLAPSGPPKFRGRHGRDGVIESAIARRAYEIFLEGKSRGGDADWLRAEQELRPQKPTWF
jgi:hypothetical protein